MSDGVAGIAKQITDVEIAGIPIGAAALGGVSALVLAEVTDAILVHRIPTVPVLAIKGGEVYAMHRWGHKVFGAGGARIATYFLGYDFLRTLVPMETWIRNLVAKLPGGVAAANNNPGNPGPQDTTDTGGNGHKQADAMTFLRQSVETGGGA